MWRRSLLCLLIAGLAAIPLVAQAPPDFPPVGDDLTQSPTRAQNPQDPPPDGEDPTQHAPAEQEEKSSSSPLDLSLGLQENNALGAILKGDGLLTSERAWLDQGNKDHVSFSGFISYLVDASWNTAEDANNNASVSLRPTLALNFVQGSNSGDIGPSLDPYGYLYLFLDVRQRYGEFEDEEGAIEDVNQTILGAGLGGRLKFLFPKYYVKVANATKKLPEQPRLEVTWHTVNDSSEVEASLPDGLVADQIRARLSGDLPLYHRSLCPEKDGKTSCRWILFADVSGTQATDGDDRDWNTLYDIGLKYDLLDGNIKPVIHYKSGEEHGLQYDEQILFGAILSLAGLSD